MKLKKIVALMLAAMLVVALAACGGGESEGDGEGAAEARTIQIGTPSAADETDPYYYVAEYMRKYVEENGDGSLVIEVYPNSTLGDEVEMFESLQAGTLDIGILNNSCATNYIPECALLDLPFIIPDYDVAKKVLTGETGEWLMSFYEGNGMVSLGLAVGGMRVPGTMGTPIKAPEDLEGLKMRCVENQIYMDTYNALGANALPMAFSEVLTGLQQGTIDGTDFGPAVYYTSGFADIMEYISVTNQFCAVLSVDVSESLWNELTDEQKEMLSTAAKEGCAEALDLQKQNDEEALQLLADAGVEIIPLEDIDIDAFKSKLDGVYESYMDQIGQENYDKLVEAIEAAQAE